MAGEDMSTNPDAAHPPPSPAAQPLAKEAPAAAVSFRDALRYWVKLGFINFGGPAGQIAIMHRDLVERKGWIAEAHFLRALNFCMLLPGPEAQQLATYMGWRLHGVWGGVAAGLWFILPSVFVLLALSWMVAAHGDVPLVAGLLYGVQPVVIAIVAEAVLRIGRRTLHHWGLFGLAGAAFVAIYFGRVPFPAIVLGAALLGLFLGRRWPQVFRPSRLHASASSGQEAAAKAVGAKYPPALRAVKVLALFLVLWLAPVGALLLWQGRTSIYAQEAFFFTGAAFVTFGGAYAVLSYIAHASVNVYLWLEPSHMVHGLALAESTPGPLIMVTQYVGFLAAWKLHGDLAPLASGILGALTVTYVTFLPSFMFIFVGAPYIEALANNRRLQAALAGVTAAVVGVILNLAVFFATKVLLPENKGLDAFALVVAIAAFLVLWRLRWQTPAVVGAGAVVGVVWVLGRRGLGV
jgi:chromate transporter